MHDLDDDAVAEDAEDELTAVLTVAADLIPQSVHAIDAFWKARRHSPRRATKTGRNDPCPCGSGRKYKRCCGAN